MLNFQTILSILSIFLVLLVIFVLYFKWKVRYWKKRNVVCFEEPKIPFGNLGVLWKEKFVFANGVRRIYEAIKNKGLKHAGGYLGTSPCYLPIDPNIIKTIMVQGFENFPERFYGENRKDERFTDNLFFDTGERWKHFRTKSIPAFTSAKMRILLDGVLHCSRQMLNELDSRNKTVDFTKIAPCYFADVIGVTVYGLDCNSFKDPKLEFITQGRNLIDASSKTRFLKAALKSLYPKLYNRLGLTIFDKEPCEFFINLTKETAKFRKENNLVRNDLFQMTLDAEPELNFDEIDDETTESGKLIKYIASQLSVYFIGGFETSSATFTFCLSELTQNLTIQEKLREEIDRVLFKYEGKITYDAIMEMTYMSQVLSETLRKYPAFPNVTRKCVKDYKISDTPIEKDIIILIPIIALHYDPEYFPDPEKFDPERFSEENKQKIKPFTYLPFGEGPKMCPAYRFGLMQLKVGLIALLQRYRITLNERTKFPIEIAPVTLTLRSKSEVYLDFEDRNSRK